MTIIKQIIYWIIRKKSPALYFLRAGVFLLTLAAAADITFSVESGDSFKLDIDIEGNIPSLLIYTTYFLGIALISIAIPWEIIRHTMEYRALSRKRVNVIEVRGLRDSAGTPLNESLPPYFEGRRNSILVDLRQNIRDGYIVEPQVALDKLVHITYQLDQYEAGNNRNDITTVFGGLAPVPLTFLAGTILDDESEIHIFDWERHKKRWQQLEKADDGNRFDTKYLGTQLDQESTEAVLAISISYIANLPEIQKKLPNIPLIHLELQNAGPDSHWSEDKQRALGRQFLEMLTKLDSYGINHIHLFIAGPSSLVFRFGTLYDKRNLPKVTVYQYQRGETPAYPWGITMPTSGVCSPRLEPPHS